jgi:hypothetical protein
MNFVDVFSVLNSRLPFSSPCVRANMFFLQSSNRVGDEGAKALAAALQRNSSVQELNLV